ncbi:MAG: ABC transporter substrate-binding protein, partial [Verrucomicrobiales bacterium]
MSLRFATLVLVLGVLLSGCKHEPLFEPRDATEELEVFRQQINEETRERLASELTVLEEALAGELDPSERVQKEEALHDLRRRMERPDFYEIFEESDLPEGLVWETGMDEPDLGSPNAKKGGTFHTYMLSLAFPPTIRACGKESNNSFRSFHWDNIEMGLVSLHPNTGNIIPGIADRWAVAEDGQSVFFHIDEDARWSDGKDVTAEDFLMTLTIYLSPYLDQSFFKLYYTGQYWGIATYGDDYLCIRLAYPKPFAPYYASLAPFQKDFYSEFGPDFNKRYNWRARPTTGAYVIREEDIHKGRSIAQTRVKDWWAKDKKYYRNRFNVDRIEYRLVRDEEKVFQMFLRGDIDLYWLNGPSKWYERTEVEPVFNGYIERAVFYNEYPRVSRGLYMNFAKPPLDDLNVRIGLNHATNWEKVIELDLRGDAERLNLLNEGFGDLSNPNIQAREYSVTKAREAFAKAGYTIVDDDGVLMNEEGRRLSFTITHVKHPSVDPMLLRLKEEALRAGVEFKLEGMDATSSFQRTSRKEHEITFTGWGVTPPLPDYYQQFHSKEAYLPGTRKPRPMTNNISTFADPEVDRKST